MARALATLRSAGPMTVGAVAVISSALALAFALWPTLKPDPRDRLGADLGVFAVETRVTHDAWIRRVSPTPGDYGKLRTATLRDASLDGDSPGAEDERQILRQRGTLFYVKMTIEGFKRRNVTLRWSLYSERTRRRLPEPGLHDVPVAGVRLEAPTDRSFVQVWVPPVASTGRCFARFELVTRGGTLLAVADSPRFAASL
jgi:hypothetical protein